MGIRACSKILLLAAVICAANLNAGEKPATVYEDQQQGDQLLTLGTPRGKRFEVKDISWPVAPGGAEICLWKDDKVAAVSLTIDDNCKPDHQWWLEQCKKHNIKVTFFVIGGPVGGKTTSGFSGTWEDWQTLVDTGMVSVQTHTISHKSKDNERSPEEMDKEYADSQKLMNDHLKNSPCVALAYPCGNGRFDIAGKYFIAARGTYGMPNEAGRIDYINTRAGHMGLHFIDVIVKGSTDKGPKWANDKKFYRGWFSPLTHLVHYGKNDAERKKAADEYAAMIDYMMQFKDQLWVDTFVDVAKYGQERDSATLTVTKNTPTEIAITVKDRMRDDIFDLPLTVKVRLPEGMKTPKATQNGKEVGCRVVSHEGANFALVDIIPDKGETVIK